MSSSAARTTIVMQWSVLDLNPFGGKPISNESKTLPFCAFLKIESNNSNKILLYNYTYVFGLEFTQAWDPTWSPHACINLVVS